MALAALAFDAAALGFGAAPSSAVLGRSLDQVIPLRLEAGESVSPECVSVEATIGDRRVPSSDLATRIEGEGHAVSLRVLSNWVVDEPVLSLSVGVGCPVRLSRRFVLFADPPAALAPSAPLPAPETVAAGPQAAAPAAAGADLRTGANASAADNRASLSSASAAPRPAERKPPPPRRATSRAADSTLAASPRAAGRPRLQLDAVDPAELKQARASATELAASAAAAIADAQAAAQAAADAASASQRRVVELERAIEKMRADAQADREALLALRQRAAQSDSSNLQMLLIALVAALATLSLWLALRLRRVQHDQQLAWLAAARSAEDTGAAATQGERTVPPADTLAMGPTTAGPTTRPSSLSPVFAPEPVTAPAALLTPDLPEMPVERTQALPVGWRDESEQARDVSVEELIDLEQQAEFFSVLGQEDAAIDLLVDYLRSTGGGSPMPYLKLLEIYRRRGDREAYDRTRARFNHRFNAYAPDWDDDPAQGRSLEDYPSIIARLQMAWPSPIDAMAELESLLFRKSRGELFDLPAYRDVLFLYSLARDLLDREPLVSGNVDVLLPISDGGEFTQPMSLDDSPASRDSAMMPLDNPPTVPVDLDVTQPAMPESLFGETATLPGAQTRRRI